MCAKGLIVEYYIPDIRNKIQVLVLIKENKTKNFTD